MELWIIYVLISTILSGFSEFLNRLSVYKKLNSKRVIFYMRTSLLVSAIFYFIFFGSFKQLTIYLIIICFVRTFFAVNKSVFQIEALKNVDSIMFFPIVKTLQIFIAFFIGMIFFNEFLSFNEIISIMMGFVVIFLLTNRSDIKKQKDFKVGLFFIFMFVSFISVSSSINKYIAEFNYDFGLFFLVSNILGFIYSYFLYGKDLKKQNVNHQFEEVLYGLVIGLIAFFSFNFLLIAHRSGDFVIITLIKSFSIFVPIFLSIVFLGEHLTWRKGLAFVFFVIFLFIV